MFNARLSTIACLVEIKQFPLNTLVEVEGDKYREDPSITHT